MLAGTTPVITNLTNPNEKVLNLPAGTVSASVTATGTTTPALLGPADVPVVEGTSTIVYAWGSATASPATLALATQTITGLHSNPSGVNAGEVGLVSDGRHVRLDVRDRRAGRRRSSSTPSSRGARSPVAPPPSAS